MGIALGYAFLLAIAGGLIAICLAWLGELTEDRPAEDPRGETLPAQRQAVVRRHARSGGLRHQF